MDLSEVYSKNIMPWAISNFINCDKEDSELVDAERERFKNFIIWKSQKGVNFVSQITAWEAYKEMMVVVVRKADPMLHLDREKSLDNSQSRWEKDLMNLAFEIANLPRNLANYDDRRAQM